ncbi:MAG: glucose 1-dehydrogenase [Phycisphaerae bacterium]|nr:glucose 1-dehydrogenase [Phycisphaerae bacterium]MDW8262515.1 glucose 1-dehydrogenase [Phycisphaerales bacterium]
MRYQERHAVVTGGAKGIGAATARALAAEGARVSILDVDETAGQLAAELPGARFFRCDVSRSVEVEAAIEQAIAASGDIWVLVNNAGIQTYGTCVDTTEAEWDRTMNVNLKSAFLCSKAAIPSMLRRGGGVIVNLASVQAFVSQHQVAAYTTSKTALLGLTRSIAVDYAPKVRCVAVCPGTIDTPMLRNAIELSPDPQEVLQECHDMHPVKRIGRPEEVAALIVFLCSDEAGFITGQPIRIDGGLGLSIGGSKRS